MNWLDTVRKIAPTVASVLGGPAAGMAVSALGSILGVAEPTQDKIATMIEDAQLTADHLAEIRKLELQYQNDEKERGFKYEELATDDRKSARDMQMATHSVWPGILSAITTLAVLGVIAARMMGQSLPNDPTTVQLIGSLTTGWGMALAYWFGTTRSSSEKNAYLANSAPAK
jgi:hypothetical protein